MVAQVCKEWLGGWKSDPFGDLGDLGSGYLYIPDATLDPPK